jgi:hypothetical protein
LHIPTTSSLFPLEWILNLPQGILFQTVVKEWSDELAMLTAPRRDPSPAGAPLGPLMDAQVFTNQLQSLIDKIIGSFEIKCLAIIVCCSNEELNNSTHPLSERLSDVIGSHLETIRNIFNAFLSSKKSFRGSHANPRIILVTVN